MVNCPGVGVACLVTVWLGNKLDPHYCVEPYTNSTNLKYWYFLYIDLVACMIFSLTIPFSLDRSRSFDWTLCGNSQVPGNTSN